MKYTIKNLQDIMSRKHGNLYLRGTGITALPEGLTVGGSLDLRGTEIDSREKKKVKELKQGDYEEGKYLYADKILTHVKRRVNFGKYTYYIGKIKEKNVISDGENYAHCKNPKEGIADLEFKAAKSRGAEQYKGLTPESKLSYNDAITAYRIITGACRAGTESFLKTLKEVKDSYTVGEIIELTMGQYGNAVFRNFFQNADK